MVDLGAITEPIFGERWETFQEPIVPEIRSIQRAIARVAGSYRGRWILRFDWLAGLQVTRMGRKVYANPIARKRVPFHEYFDDERKLWVNEFESLEVRLARWGLRMLVPDERGKPAHEANRYRWEDQLIAGRVVPVRVDVLGPYPVEGKYTEVLNDFGCLAEHDSDGLCCYNRSLEAKPCYGRYRAPTWETVHQIEEWWRGVLRSQRNDRTAQEDPNQRDLYEDATRFTADVEAAEDRYFGDVEEEASHRLDHSGVPIIDLGAAHAKADDRLVVLAS